MKPKMTIADAANVLGITKQGVHKKVKSHGVILPKVSNKHYIDHSAAKQVFQHKFKNQTIAMQIVKGGVGKTTLVHSIATRASLYGAKVLCIDLDQQANLTRAFNIDPSKTPVMIDILDKDYDIKDSIMPAFDGVDIVPSRMDNANLDNLLILKKLPLDRVYKMLIKDLKKEYDLILFDCPPALGQSVTASALAVDWVISPVTPEEFSIDGLKVSASELKKVEKMFGKKIPIKILLNKFDSRTNLSHDVLSSLISIPSYKKVMFKSYIRVSQAFANVISLKNTIYDSTKPSPEKEDIDLITREILGLSLN
jgi:chromosome partitioning protein